MRQKSTEIDANTKPVLRILYQIKSEAKSTEIDANTEPVVEFYFKSKVRQKKKPDFDANQSDLLMGVVMIYKYSKRFRFAPSF